MTEQTSNLLNEKLALAAESIDDLIELKNLGDLEYFRDHEKEYFAVCYRFITGIEALLEAGHLVLVAKSGRAEDQITLAKKLAVQGIISTEQSEALISMYGFRNRLVHAYGTLDDDKVIEYLQDKLTDLQDILRLFKEFVDN